MTLLLPLWCMKTKRNDGRLNQHCLNHAGRTSIYKLLHMISVFQQGREKKCDITTDAECDAMRIINEIDDGSSFIQTKKQRKLSKVKNHS